MDVNEELRATAWTGDGNMLVIFTQIAFTTASKTAIGTGYTERRD